MKNFIGQSWSAIPGDPSKCFRTTIMLQEFIHIYQGIYGESKSYKILSLHILSPIYIFTQSITSHICNHFRHTHMQKTSHHKITCIHTHTKQTDPFRKKKKIWTEISKAVSLIGRQVAEVAEQTSKKIPGSFSHYKH